jgi:subtilisin family serine protease
VRVVTLLVVLALLAPLAAAAAPLHRVAILTDDVLGVPTIGGDPDVGFVVVAAQDGAALRARFGDRVVPEAPAWAASVPNDPLWARQWGPQALGMDAAWSLENGSTSVKVAIVDSGLDAAHPDFAGVPIENGTDYVDGDATPEDLNGHGTHVAGILAAARDNGLGIAGIARATLVPIRVLDANGQGNCLDIALAVLEAVARGVSVINLSLECGSDYAPLHLAIQAAARAGVLVVAAAGNRNTSPFCPSYPAAYREVLAVAGLDDATSVAAYSCQGAAVELAAPGSNIVSTWRGGGYFNLSGTSMAAPHVAGIAALVKAHVPSMDGAAIRARLDASAVDLGAPGRDDAFGYGRVDPVAALSG